MPIYWNNFPNERILKSCTLLIFTWSCYVYVVVPSFVTNLVCLVFIYIQVYRIAATRLTKNANEWYRRCDSDIQKLYAFRHPLCSCL
ncbi:Hypothetical predicted protein [Cloeon dipterum]|uniref:Uncharacterized protein n=1 Tax=Cloeon dipterum TaxID=197152 RepID=A0A8S1DAA8_9INSE|nr:Hypothetical predicted protein [Cloeon dipterum]